ncbi:hypothetical protein IC582_000457 [Cucumis melo]
MLSRVCRLQNIHDSSRDTTITDATLLGRQFTCKKEKEKKKKEKTFVLFFVVPSHSLFIFASQTFRTRLRLSYFRHRFLLLSSFPD